MQVGRGKYEQMAHKNTNESTQKKLLHLISKFRKVSDTRSKDKKLFVSIYTSNK
jgi:hypothetical protein